MAIISKGRSTDRTPAAPVTLEDLQAQHSALLTKLQTVTARDQKMEVLTQLKTVSDKITKMGG